MRAGPPLRGVPRTPMNTPFPDATAAAGAVLRFLSERLDLDLVMLTRTEGDDWLVLEACDRSYGVPAGSTLRWSDSFCSRMVRGEGPRVSPDARAEPRYADAPVAAALPIGSYVGVPLRRADGSLFGTLCGIDPRSKDPRLADEQPLVELCGRLLSTMVEAEAAQADTLRRAERAEVEALTDGLTGLLNARGWGRLLDAEEERSRRSGSPACVLSIDLNGLKRVNDGEGHAAGDALIRAAGEAIRGTLRCSDFAARVGGDEFLVCAVDTRHLDGERLRQRLLGALDAAGVSAAIGLAPRVHGEGLPQAVVTADHRMYLQKRSQPPGLRRDAAA